MAIAHRGLINIEQWNIEPRKVVMITVWSEHIMI